MEYNTNLIINNLINTKRPVESMNFPILNKLGIHAYFSKIPSIGKFQIQSKSNIIYVGRSLNTYDRIFDQELGDGKTGKATIRRSLGAIFKDDGQLYIAIPRVRNNQKNIDYTNFMFIMECEKKLTNWMKQNLELSVYYPEGLAHNPDRNCVERELKKIKKDVALAIKPLLNIDDLPDLQTSKDIMKLRAICANEARDDRYLQN